MCDPEFMIVEFIAQHSVIEGWTGIDDGLHSVMFPDNFEPFPDPFPDGCRWHSACFFDIQHGWKVSAGEFHLLNEVCRLLSGTFIRQKVVVGSATDSVLPGASPVSVETGIFQSDSFCRLDERKAESDASFLHLSDSIPCDMSLVM